MFAAGMSLNTIIAPAAATHVLLGAGGSPILLCNGSAISIANPAARHVLLGASGAPILMCSGATITINERENHA